MPSPARPGVAVATVSGRVRSVYQCLWISSPEADDLIGTLAQATQQDMDIVVVSNDKDLMQLVTPRVTFYDAAKDRRFDPAGVAAHMGGASCTNPRPIRAARRCR